MCYNTYSNPSDLRITDIRFVDIDGAPKRCTLIKIMTNQGIEGYGEVRDASTKTYAAMLKSRLIGENPCDVDRLFRKIKQFGFIPARAAAFPVSRSLCGIWPVRLTACPCTRCWAASSVTPSVFTATPTWTASTPVTTWVWH